MLITTASQAAAWIREHITYKPGWTITPEVDVAAALFGDDIVNITTHRRELDTNKLGTGETTDVYGGTVIVIPPGGIPSGDLAAAVLWGLVSDETHEVREFLRVDDRAPFHPHRDDGRAHWRETAVPVLFDAYGKGGLRTALETLGNGG